MVITRGASENTGILRCARTGGAVVASALARIGSATVASACTDTRAASDANLPQLCASSRLDPEAPPKCGTSVTICSANR